MNEIDLFSQGAFMTTKEVAESLDMSVEAVQKSVKKLAENNTRVI